MSNKPNWKKKIGPVVSGGRGVKPFVPRNPGRIEDDEIGAAALWMAQTMWVKSKGKPIDP